MLNLDGDDLIVRNYHLSIPYLLNRRLPGTKGELISLDPAYRFLNFPGFEHEDYTPHETEIQLVKQYFADQIEGILQGQKPVIDPAKRKETDITPAIYIARTFGPARKENLPVGADLHWALKESADEILSFLKKLYTNQWTIGKEGEFWKGQDIQYTPVSGFDTTYPYYSFTASAIFKTNILEKQGELK